MIEEQLVTLISDDADIAALISDRVHPLVLPQLPLLPAIVYQRISTRDEQSHAGPGLVVPRFQFSCWGATYKSARTVYAALDALLDGYRDANMAVLAAGARDDEDETTRAEQDLGRVRVIADYFVHHVKAA